MSKTITEVLAKDKAKVNEVKAMIGKSGLPAMMLKAAVPTLPVNRLDKMIQSYVEEGKTGNTMLSFKNKKQTLDGTGYPLGDVFVKAKLKGADAPEYLLVRTEDSLDATVYAGGENDDQRAFVVSTGSDGKDIVSELETFQSLSTKPIANGELGILTNYDSKVGLSTGFIKGDPNLDAVKQLLLPASVAVSVSQQPKLVIDNNNE